ncbi:hypothetical protein TELCIR_04075 [Teladorsagia circumcincta]|uniref:Uncharacterized protein n=1 Tax=Teladorsagia circumcincta TaxID=45464 RepID=A0A2G9UWR2_TELCI|nr:hypothetical protein TELCIR_04075 [Teladorsagia circumcincta]
MAAVCSMGTSQKKKVRMLANAMCENLQFAQVFSNAGEIPLLTDLFG